MTIESFAVTWDYRCPFARIGHEHLIDALEAGAPWDVTFVPYFLNVSHVAEGGPSAWEDTSHQPDLLALLVGIVVRDRFSEHFLAVHRRLFNLRHDEGGDLRSREVLSAALAEVGVDPDAVWAEVDAGWPAEVARAEHEDVVGRLDVFGVPTFIVGDDAVFVRLMQHSGGDAAVARSTIDNVLGLMEHHPEINEFKHTQLKR